MIPKAIEGSTSRYIVSFTLEIPSILGDAKTINHHPFDGWRKTKGRASKHREVEPRVRSSKTSLLAAGFSRLLHANPSLI